MLDWSWSSISSFIIPIVLFTVMGVCGLAAIISKAITIRHEQNLRHRERMALIQMGMNPDQPEETPWDESVKP